MVKVALFDFFGTLLEQGTQSPTRQTLGILRTRLPYPRFVVSFEQVFMTKEFASQADAFAEVCNAFRVRPYPIVIEKLIGVWNKNKILAKPYDETFDVLTKLRENGVKTVLLANLDSFTYSFLKEKFELENYFDALLPSCETGMLKTQPGAVDKALELVGGTKEEAFFVGDSIESDMKAAEVAGIRGILVDRKGNREYPGKIPTLNELEAELANASSND